MGQRAHGTQRPRCNAIATTTTAGGIDTQTGGGKLNQSWFTNTWNYRNHIHCTGITRVMLNATWKKCRLNDWTIGQTYALLLLRQSERRGGKLWKSRCQDRESGMLEIHLLCRCCAFNSPRSGLFIFRKEVKMQQHRAPCTVWVWSWRTPAGKRQSWTLPSMWPNLRLRSSLGQGWSRWQKMQTLDSGLDTSSSPTTQKCTEGSRAL